MDVVHVNNHEVKKNLGGRPNVDLEKASNRTLLRKFKPLDDLVEQYRTTEGRIVMTPSSILIY